MPRRAVLLSFAAMRRPFPKIMRWLAAAMALPLSAFLMILGGSVIPANSDTVRPTPGVTIYVYTNGVHTGLVLPAVTALHDWRGRVRTSDLADPSRAGQWLMFGWGQRDFYLNTPTWDEVDPLIVLRAAIGSDATLMHVDHLRRIWRGPDLRPLVLTAAQYQALARAVDADFAPGAAIRGYGADDVFYPGRGRYSALRTCNEWTGGKLRAIGVKIGVWTPISWSVMRWF
ncbi:MAG: DUF2459 domain-containing protein [Sphingobium sp.]